MLVNMKDLLSVAQEHKFAIPAFNIGSGQILKAVIQSANERKSPVILAIHPSELEFLEDSFVASCIEEANKTSVPMVIHLDHGGSMEEVFRAIRCGFTSVMIDASHLPFEENIAICKQVVEVAHPLNISVEGELGTIGNTGDSAEGGADQIVYTDPDDAKEFVEKTGIDTLAVAIGTKHGLYPSTMKPELRLELLKEIQEKVEIPLVLHGGSSNPDDEIAESVNLGITKINISSDTKSVFYEKANEIFAKNGNLFEPNAIYPECIVATRKVIENKMELFKSVDKTHLYY